MTKLWYNCVPRSVENDRRWKGARPGTSEEREDVKSENAIALEL